MPGPWQHNIPQSLLRGFRVRGGTKKTSRVWLFEKGREPTLEFVKAVAAADNFYSAPSVDGSKTLDEQITDYERTSFDRALHYLKAAEPSSVVDAASAAEVVAHLTIRNDHLRQTFGEASQKLFAEAIDVFCNEVHVRPLLRIDDKEPPATLIKAIDDFLVDHPEVGNIPVPRQVLYRMAHMGLREGFNSSFLQCAPQMMTVLTSMIAQAPAYVREGHNKALASELAPGPRIELLRQFTWTARAAGTEAFVLPDCVALGLETGKHLQPLMMAGLSESSLVLMPLSSRKILVGTRTAKDEPDLADFNKAASACSHRFFIAATNDFAELAANIGTASHHFMEEAVGTLIKQYKKGDRSDSVGTSGDSADTDVTTNDNAPISEAAPPAAPQFTIQFRDCADQATGERIGANVFAVTSEMCRMMPLERLDGVTFAYDYPAALRELDRGFATSPLEPTIGFDLLYVFVIVCLDRRDMVWINVTANPTAEWISRQLTEAFSWGEAPRYLVRDRDQIYGAVVTRRLRAMGIRDKPTAPASPWQNGFAERLIGSIRRECVDHFIVLGEAHLRRILRAYASYYNDIRTHWSLAKDAPVSRPVQRTGVISSRPILGGLHHHYIRV